MKKAEKEKYKMRRHLIIVLLAMVGLFLGTNGFAQERKGPGVGDIASKTAEGQRINAFMVEKIIGSKVINVKGETLGKVEDLVVDIDRGRIVYAILDSGGFLDIGGKLFAVPWKSLGAIPSEGIFFLNQSKEQMEKAPAFEKKNLPDMGDMNWGANVFKYYGAPSAYAQGEPLGYDYDYGYHDYYGSNYPISPGSGINPPPGAGDPYQKIFDSKTIKTISGQVIKIDQVPEFGFGFQMRLIVFIDKKEILPVYLGPAFYVTGHQQAKHFKLGDKVTVSGSQVTVSGEPLMIAMTVKRGNEILRLRDQEGIPAWIGWKRASD
jgi:sporulation protein YlmC with PRC-barrel domain